MRGTSPPRVEMAPPCSKPQHPQQHTRNNNIGKRKRSCVQNSRPTQHNTLFPCAPPSLGPVGTTTTPRHHPVLPATNSRPPRLARASMLAELRSASGLSACHNARQQQLVPCAFARCVGSHAPPAAAFPPAFFSCPCDVFRRQHPTLPAPPPPCRPSQQLRHPAADAPAGVTTRHASALQRRAGLPGERSGEVGGQQRGDTQASTGRRRRCVCVTQTQPQTLNNCR